MLTSRLSQSVARHQREQKILTAAKTLAKLNGANKRLSKQTVESLEVAEKKAAEAEKVGGMTNGLDCSSLMSTCLPGHACSARP
jgi:hypothetical protein